MARFLIVVCVSLMAYTPTRCTHAELYSSQFYSLCAGRCKCLDRSAGLRVDCSAVNLTKLPTNLSAGITHLNLSSNNISVVEEDAFKQCKSLEELRLDGNALHSLPPHVFTQLSLLKKLYLSDNSLTTLPEHCFLGLVSLQQLWLANNDMRDIPTKALKWLPSLTALTLSLNQLTEVPNFAFSSLKQLSVLLLYENKIASIGEEAFAGLDKLRVLELDRNRLTKLPEALASLSLLEELSMTDNRIKYLPDNSFTNNRKLTTLRLKNNPILSVGKHAFANLPKLERLVLSAARAQVEFPDFTGTMALESLALDRGVIKAIPNDFCKTLPKIKSFDIHSNAISRIPDMSGCKDLQILNLANNELMELKNHGFSGLTQLCDLILSHNYIEDVPSKAFEGLPNLQYLDLQHNKIMKLDPDVFVPIKNLEDLNLGENYFSTLPTKGLGSLKNLKTFGNPALKNFPTPDEFPEIHLLTLTYPYHCCQFITAQTEVDGNEAELKEDIKFLRPHDYDMSHWINMTKIFEPVANMSSIPQVLYDEFGTDYSDSNLDNMSPSVAQYFANYMPKYDAEDFIVSKPRVVCKPAPGPFMPCEDLMGWWWLRCGVWIVFLLALLGNGTVLFVSVLARSKMDVPRFLICNLACADFCMGVYLGFLAIVDVTTLGEFKMHAINWQTSMGCLMAGFLAVLSSELSVYALTVITLERFYAITHAMHLNKRLSIRHAGYVMAGGWCFAILLACLPLFGISDYRKFAVCLPFEIEDGLSQAYVSFMMFVNCVAFCVIVACYTKMYCSVRGSQAWNSNDSRVAKRMALLVFTDFACWAPISFFSLTAAFGHHLISLDDAKVFTIFVLPLNSCANPFLYAVFTKQFKKDTALICKRLEETTLNRSLSHASNRHFSFTLASSRRPSALNSFFNTRMHQHGNSRMVVSNGDARPPDSIISGSSLRRMAEEAKGSNSGSDDDVGSAVNDNQVTSCCSHSKPANALANTPSIMTLINSVFRPHRSAKKTRTAKTRCSCSVGDENVGSTCSAIPLKLVRIRRRSGCNSPSHSVSQPRGSSSDATDQPDTVALFHKADNTGCSDKQQSDTTLDDSGQTGLSERALRNSGAVDGDSPCNNNNHDYINITQDMISGLSEAWQRTSTDHIAVPNQTFKLTFSHSNPELNNKPLELKTVNTGSNRSVDSSYFNAVLHPRTQV